MSVSLQFRDGAGTAPVETPLLVRLASKHRCPLPLSPSEYHGIRCSTAPPKAGLDVFHGMLGCVACIKPRQ